MKILRNILAAALLLAPAAVLADEPLGTAQGESRKILSGESDIRTPAVGETSASTATAPSPQPASQPSPAALRLYREEDLRRSPVTRKDGPYKVKRGERVALCLDMSPEEYRGSGGLTLFADKKWTLGSLGYHRYWKCANLNGVAFNTAGQRTVDVQSGGAWVATLQVTVE